MSVVPYRTPSTVQYWASVDESVSKKISTESLQVQNAMIL